MWAAAALLGIAVTAALTWSVSHLAGQRIGLSSEPLSVNHGLAPGRTGTADSPSEPSPSGEDEAEPTTSTTGAEPAAGGPATSAPGPPIVLPVIPVHAGAPAVASGASGSPPSSGGDRADDSAGGGGHDD
jgi:hypothetical protein